MTKTLLRFKGESLPGMVAEHCRDPEPTAENDFADFRPRLWRVRHITSGAV